MKQLECDLQVRVLVFMVDFISIKDHISMCLCMYINEMTRITNEIKILLPAAPAVFLKK